MINRIKRIVSTDLVKVSSLTAVSTVIRMLTGFVLVKVIAVVVGPSGLAILGQLNGFVAIVLVIGTLGINNGITKYVAEFGESRKREIFIATAVKLSVSSSLIVGLLLIMFSSLLSNKILYNEGYSSVFIVFGITLVFYSLNTILLCILNGLKLYKKFVVINILASIIGLIFSAFLLYFYGLYGALIGTVTFQSVVFFVTPFFLKDQPWFKLSILKRKFSNKASKLFLSYSLMTLFSTCVGPGMQLFVRNFMIGEIGIVNTGLWDSTNKLSTAYLAIFTTSLTVYFIPRFSEINDKAEIKREIFKSIKLLAPFLLIMLTGIYFLRGHIIKILFTAEFIKISDIIIYQLIGDFFKVISWLFAFLLLAKAMTTKYILSELFFNSLLTFLTVYSVQQMGLVGGTIAYMVNYIIFFIFYLIFFLNYVKEK